ncbi:MAG TPA: CDGSH iron-sulfur domain-containing protein [Casimicrobiaceae bacterium]|nr:CDGSH iron-sulfur domain-containing protein [Casimicrobiaceae bacterium]
MDDTDPAVGTVTVSRNGPYLVTGNLPIGKQVIGTDPQGNSVRWEAGHAYPHPARYALCRCGHSADKPFCDGTHKRIGFDGTETASREPYMAQAKLLRGPAMSLTDVEALCAFGRFCDPNGSVWTLVDASGESAARAAFTRQTCDCPSGRLVAWDNATGKPVEHRYEPSIGVVEDPTKGCAGPLWLRGGVQVIGADGFRYEVRNRVTLCRCGASRNKPFCDGTHAAIGFRDDR